MAIIKMESEAVRGMTVRLRSTADDIETHLVSIKASVTSAGWQSQAREEFIMDLEMLVRMSQQSLSAMRMMSQAVDRKTDQWEAISQIFYGPFYFIENIWDSALGILSSSWDWLVGGMGNIHWPTFPSIVIPSVTIPGIVGGISGVWPGWNPERPDWWPLRPKASESEVGGSTGVDAGGGIDREGGSDATIPAAGDESQPVEIPHSNSPENVKLSPVNENNESCARYAANRRPDLGSTQSNNENWADGAAANYIGKFEDTAFQYTGNDTNLNDVVGEGYAVVWEPDHSYANDTYGHVGIVEDIYSDHVVISHSIRDGNGIYHQRTKTLSMDYLNDQNIWLIP